MMVLATGSFSTSAVRKAEDKDGHEAAHGHEESFEEFTARYGVQLGVPEGYRACLLHSRNNSYGPKSRPIANMFFLLERRYEKEFDQVQDVFELQVCN